MSENAKFIRECAPIRWDQIDVSFPFDVVDGYERCSSDEGHTAKVISTPYGMIIENQNDDDSLEKIYITPYGEAIAQDGHTRDAYIRALRILDCASRRESRSEAKEGLNNNFLSLLNLSSTEGYNPNCTSKVPNFRIRIKHHKNAANSSVLCSMNYEGPDADDCSFFLTTSGAILYPTGSFMNRGKFEMVIRSLKKMLHTDSDDKPLIEGLIRFLDRSSNDDNLYLEDPNHEGDAKDLEFLKRAVAVTHDPAYGAELYASLR